MRRRSRGGGGYLSSLTFVLILALFAALFVGGAGLESTAFRTGETPRGATADVTIDESGAHALDTTSAVHINATEPLVNVTNHLTQDVTVTVTLADGSTDIGSLVVDGVSEGNVATFTLAAGGTQTVDLAVPDDESLVGRTVYFHVGAQSTGLEVNATDRNAPVNG